MQEIEYNEQAEKALELLKKGGFMTTKADGKINTMTIGWGSLGYAWREPFFMVMVRPSRLTFEMIEKSGEFTVSLPYEMKKELMFCGTKSGHNTNKFSELGLKTVESKEVSPPLIDCEGLHYECKVIYKQKMNPEFLENAIDESCYPKKDYHTLYFGKIVKSYIN